MKITIEYCQKWNYKPRASSLEAEIKEKYNADIDLLASSGGVFEVTVDEKLIYSKKEFGRFPEEGEVGRFREEGEVLDLLSRL